MLDRIKNKKDKVELSHLIEKIQTMKNRWEKEA